ncbi:hypothetical protein N646_1833 [Vibrio alginolyticus NBRC 15630 = ATCC 17749]|uniref:Uncharacterized protein n=1 Tax=Vibrio alginolyticus (strain ATCC 17749 / DSM 2171 / NBRC 15630 / NCIMB 1903 / NCTC 12160 / XII-53) TaxID=1219076 RepID=A0A2I3CBV4_VIBAX|nr:hypothetical protein N646_1833 [Vibrio alginolyticus NBRC 15630 = ATCC 17749]CDT98774.1 hypothetical protein VDIAB_30498 [Vibrio diabolicus]
MPNRPFVVKALVALNTVGFGWSIALLLSKLTYLDKFIVVCR